MSNPLSNPFPKKLTFVISSGARLACEACEEMGSFPLAIPDGLKPLIFECEACGFRWYIQEEDQYPRLPKFDPTSLAAFQWKVFLVRGPVGSQELHPYRPGHVDLLDLPGLPSSEKVSIEPQAETVPFRVRSEELSATLLHGMRIIQGMRFDLAKVGERMAQELLGATGEAERFRKYLNPTLLQQFIQAPYFTFPAHCQDEIAATRTKWLAAPIFYEGIHGIPVSSHGGFYLQLLTPYVRPVLPLDDAFCQSLGVSMTPELEVYGDKILGRALRLCWHDIPGIREDDDHTPLDPSIRIVDQVAARNWLLQQGVAPWTPLPVPDEERFLNPNLDSNQLLAERELYQRASDQFYRTGRVSLFWNSFHAMQEFAIAQATILKGWTLFLAGTKQEAQQYKGMVRAEQIVGKPTIVWHSWDDFTSLGNLEAIRLIIVDCRKGLQGGPASDPESSGIPIEFLEKLYLYRGRVIVLAGNPFTDLLEENIESKVVHTLGGWGVYDTPQDWRLRGTSPGKGHPGWQVPVFPLESEAADGGMEISLGRLISKLKSS